MEGERKKCERDTARKGRHIGVKEEQAQERDRLAKEGIDEMKRKVFKKYLTAEKESLA